jgi:hypothetical protein
MLQKRVSVSVGVGVGGGKKKKKEKEMEEWEKGRSTLQDGDKLDGGELERRKAEEAEEVREEPSFGEAGMKRRRHSNEDIEDVLEGSSVWKLGEGFVEDGVREGEEEEAALILGPLFPAVPFLFLHFVLLEDLGCQC